MKKHGLFKILSLVIIALLVLSWFIPASYYSGSEMVDLGLYRVGLYELMAYPLLAVQIFLPIIVLLLTIGGFYGVLGETGKYRQMVEKFATKLKGKETIFFIVVAFLFAALQSVFGYGLILFIFVPFICSVVLYLGYDRITAFLVSFVSILIGTIGSTFDPNIIALLEETTGYQTSIYIRLGIFVICFVIYIMFLFNHIRKIKNHKKDEKAEKIEDIYLGEKKNVKKPIWPTITVLSTLFILMILGITDWAGLGVTWFSNAYTSVMSWTIGKDFTIVAHIFGNFVEFGTWTNYDFAVVLFIASIILKLVYKIKLDELLESFGKGAVKMLKPTTIVIFAHVVLVITARFPFYPTIVAWLIGMSKSFNIITTTIVTAIGSALNIEMTYLSQSSIPYIVSKFSTDANLNSISIITQTIYGLVMLVAPTSVFLILGLEYLDIPYIKWLKISWKFIVELLVILLAIIIIVTLI